MNLFLLSKLRLYNRYLILCILSSFTSVLFVLQLLVDFIGDLEVSRKRREKGVKEEQKSWI